MRNQSRESHQDLPGRFFPAPALLEQIPAEGPDVLPALIRIVINTAMQAERQQYLQAGPYERRPKRRDDANGYEPKTVNTRVGHIAFAIPQVIAGQCYPDALESGASEPVA